MTAPAPPSRSIRLLDLAVVAWVVLWVGLGTLCFVEVRGLTSLSDTMKLAGDTLDEAGRGLGAIAALPLVGSGLRPAAERIQTLAADTIEESRDSHGHITRLSLLALLVGGIIPIVTGVCLYVPVRRFMRREAAGAAAPGGSAPPAA